MRQTLLGVAGLALVLVSIATPAFAGAAVVPVPEINGSSLATGLGLLSGAVLILRARFTRK
jgi:hypothetical protein